MDAVFVAGVDGFAVTVLVGADLTTDPVVVEETFCTSASPQRDFPALAEAATFALRS